MKYVRTNRITINVIIVLHLHNILLEYILQTVSKGGRNTVRYTMYLVKLWDNKHYLH